MIAKHICTIRARSVRQLGCLFLLVFSLLLSDAWSKDWNGIIPCISTRLDAETILGKDPLPINIGSYRHGNSRISIDYYQKDKNFPNKDIVEKIHLYLDERMVLSKYIKKIPNFRKEFLKTALDDNVTHVRGLAVYRNWNEGFEIWVQRNDRDVEVITRFGYFDPAWVCSKRAPREPEKKRQN
jgi:hypothetical protein